MGQTWVVVAIVVGLGLAVALFLWSRRLDAAAKKPAQKKKAPAEKSAASPPKTEEAGAKGTPSPSSAKSAKKDESKTPVAAPFQRAETVREPAVQRRATVPIANLQPDDDDDITIVTLTPRLDLLAAQLPDAGNADDLVDDDDEPSEGPRATAVPIIYDEEAAEDEPTRATAVILVAAVGQTDRGQKRKINEDRYLALDEHNLYVVADGMGGHAGGEVASQTAVDTIQAAFTEQRFEGEPYPNVPRRGSELAQAIQMANRAIHERAKREPKLHGMGTTIVSARFTPGKERVYIGHVGDSRCYRFRSGQLTQITTDHTMGAVGMTGPFADHLSRAVGIAPAVKVDLVIAKPRHEDVFLLCSDGLSKMVKDDAISEILGANPDPAEAVKALVQRANERGGRDNITVILVVVKDPSGFARYVQAQQKKKKAAEAEKGVEAATSGDAAVATSQATSDKPDAPSNEAPVASPDKTASDKPAEKAAVPTSGDKALADPAAAAAPTDKATTEKAPADVTPAPSSNGVHTSDKARSSSETVAQKPADEARSSSQSVPPPRPSVPPRPSALPRIPAARVSTPDARQSNTEGRPSIPEPRKSNPDARPSTSDARQSNSEGRVAVPTPPPAEKPPEPPPAKAEAPAPKSKKHRKK
ncbi:MAG: serine/threonine-protein phosphatase [Polyangiaceae bacterium]|nr:serine/threonine-protein phosphatase [Polyangiaceae bacterium]